MFQKNSEKGWKFYVVEKSCAFYWWNLKMGKSLWKISHCSRNFTLQSLWPRMRAKRNQFPNGWNNSHLKSTTANPEKSTDWPFVAKRRFFISKTWTVCFFLLTFTNEKSTAIFHREICFSLVGRIVFEVLLNLFLINSAQMQFWSENIYTQNIFAEINHKVQALSPRMDTSIIIWFDPEKYNSQRFASAD